jgi:hypothetical protein
VQAGVLADPVRSSIRQSVRGPRLLNRRVWLTMKMRLSQMIPSCLPIAAMAVVMPLTESACMPTPERYLIPYGFEGEVIIVLGQENGEPEELEDGMRLYRIPESGVLFTQVKYVFTPVLPSVEYYYVTETGERHRLWDYWMLRRATPSDVEVLADSLTILEPASGTYGELRFRSFHVGRYREYWSRTPQQKFEGSDRLNRELDKFLQQRQPKKTD